ncbi:MAG: DUF1684 domain-containing protein [Ignavibacteriaceae bacterium]|nr:DUF1684 domain-containing protein [Ignavibacteriaceae bacterium]
MSSKTSYGLVVILFLTLLLTEACKENRNDDPEMKAYIENLIKERKEKDYSLQFDLNSPFNRDTTISFKPLNYYEPNPDFIFKSKLIVYDIQDTVAILGTRGETRPAILLGYLELKKDKKVHKINVYKSFDRMGEPYYSIWFTDRTTGKDTYGVGRYLDFELNDHPEFVYTIDFNKAYNPYCAYSALFTCPIPRVEDYIDMEIEAGEKNFH